MGQSSNFVILSNKSERLARQREIQNVKINAAVATIPCLLVFSVANNHVSTSPVCNADSLSKRSQVSEEKTNSQKPSRLVFFPDCGNQPPEPQKTWCSCSNMRRIPHQKIYASYIKLRPCCMICTWWCSKIRAMFELHGPPKDQMIFSLVSLWLYWYWYWLQYLCHNMGPLGVLSDYGHTASALARMYAPRLPNSNSVSNKVKYIALTVVLWL